MQSWLDDPDGLVPLLDPTAPPRVLTRAQANRLGWTRSAVEHQLRTGRWRRILPRVLFTAGTLTWNDRCEAALAYAGDRAMLSAAAGLHDLELRSVRRPAQLLVLTPSSTRVRSRGYVRIRATKRLPEPVMRTGPRSAPVARSVADLALATRRLDDVRAIVTEVVRRRLCTPAELAAELDAGPRNGSAHLREAISEVMGGAWSVPEAKAARLLRAAGVPAFEQNVRIPLPDGTWVVVDFLWRPLRAVLEIDSDAHHGLPGDAQDTSDRHLRLAAAGYSVVHRTPRYIARQPDEFVAGIAAWLSGLAAARRF